MARRLLNIASIVCLVLCVTLMGMWVRSYYRLDVVSIRTTSKPFDVVSCRGVFGIDELDGFPLAIDFAGCRSEAIGGQKISPWLLIRYLFRVVPRGIDLRVPYWFLVLTSGLLAMLLRLPWPLRFTLRSLFIATTFVAVVLGMIALLDRAWIGK